MTKNNNSPITEQLEAIIAKAEELAQSRNYEDAIELYNQALELDPNNETIYYARARAYYTEKLREDEKAILDLMKAIELNPDYTDAYNYLGWIYNDLKEYEKAVANLNKVIELEPKEANGYCHLAIIHTNFGRYEEAISNFQKVIELEPNANIYSQRGKAYNGLEEYEKAIADYDKLIEMGNGLTCYDYLERARAYMALEEYKKAIDDYDKAIQMKTNDADYYGYRYYHSSFHRERARAYMALGEYKKAMADYDKAIEIEPNSGYCYHQRGNAYNDLGEYQKAIVDYNKAIELDPNISDFYESRANAYKNLGDDQKADADEFKALELITLDYLSITRNFLNDEDEDDLVHRLSIGLTGNFLNDEDEYDEDEYDEDEYDEDEYDEDDDGLLIDMGSIQSFTERLQAGMDKIDLSNYLAKYNENKNYELFGYFFPKGINSIEATNLIKNFTVFCEQKQVIPYFSKFSAADTAIMDACVFDKHKNEEILIFDAMQECYQKYRGPFYFGSDFEIFIKNSNSFSYPSFVILNEFGLITKNPLTLPEFFAPIPVPQTAFDKIFWNGCNYDLLGIAEKNDKLVIVIQPHESFYLGITNMKDDDSFEVREQKKATLMFIYFLLKKYFKIYKQCEDLPYITYDSVGLLPLETEEQTSFERIIELLEITDIKIADFDALVNDVERNSWIF